MPGPKVSSPSRGLTPKFIDALQPPEKQYDLRDRRAPGLQLRVLPSGKKIFRWKLNTLRHVIVIGPFHPSEEPPPGFVSLKQAREWLERLKQARVGGNLEAVEAELQAHLRRRPHVDDPVPQDPTRRLFKKVADEFYADELAKNRKRPEDAKKVIERDLLPLLGERALDDITTLDCRDAIKAVVTRGAPVHAGKVLALLKQLYGWAQSSGFTDRNPAAPLQGHRIGVEVNVSDRALSDEEIPIFWQALDAEPATVQVQRQDARTGEQQIFEQRSPAGLAPATRIALKVLLLTGARTGELLKARWEHFSAKWDKEADPEATWTIPIANQKLTKKQARRAKAFVIPLSPLAFRLFRELNQVGEALPRKPGEAPSPWVMASAEADEGHYTDKALGRAMRRLFEDKTLRGGKDRTPLLTLPGGMASPHDLRRTMRTHLGKLRVPLHIVERCLNHSLGRIVQTYDVGDYLEERREALDKWDAYVSRLLSPKQSNVTFIAGSSR